MKYVVDGHNLIGKVPGLSLDMLDDEDRLLGLLRPFALAKKGRKIEVFFDRAPIGRAGARSLGAITAHYVQTGKTADDAIAQFLKRMGSAARSGVIVVSSDRQVQASAHAVGAEVVLSETFADALLEAAAQAAIRPDAASRSAAHSALSEGGLSEREVDDWIKAFHIDPAQADQPIEPPPTHTKVRQPGAARGQNQRGKPAKPRSHHGFPKKGGG